jgi:hypothetical protein
MSTLDEIEAAAESLPMEQKKELLRFLAERLEAQRQNTSPIRRISRSKRGFPISPGRAAFTSGDVARIELETELSR